MGLNEYLIVAALILIAIDIFVVSDIPTHIAYVILTFVVSKELPFHFMYKILLGVAIWFILVAFHYFIWKRFIVKLVNKFIAPEKRKAGLDSHLNQSGIIRRIEGKDLVQIQEELYTYSSSHVFQDGDKVTVIGNADNMLIVQKHSSTGGF
jgi:membrane protein implicated in regulation of membrane protease activity